MADTSEIKVCEKSRRIGLTWAEAAEAVLYAARARAPWDTFYMSYNREMTREFVDTCGEWARDFHDTATTMQEIVLKDGDEELPAYRIDFPSGGKIVGMPSRPTALRGMQGRVVVDEAAFIDNLAGVMKAAIALLMWGAQVRIISTHNGIDNPFAELVSEVRAKKLPYSLHRIDIEDALADGLYARILEVRSAATGKQEQWTAEGQRKWLADLVASYGSAAREELYCEPAQGGSKYFPRVMVEGRMEDGIPVVSYSRDPDFTYLPAATREADCDEWIADHLEPALAAARERAARERVSSYLGMDVGRIVDPSVIALFLQPANLHLHAAVYVELRSIPFAQQWQVLRHVCDGTPRLTAAAIDARGNGQMLAETAAQKYGPAYVHEVMISRKTYEEYMPPYRARFEDETIVIPKDAGVLDDHRVVETVRGVPMVVERTESDAGVRHGDSAVAGMLAEYAVRNDESNYQPYRYQAARVTGTGRWLGRETEDDDEWGS